MSTWAMPRYLPPRWNSNKLKCNIFKSSCSRIITTTRSGRISHRVLRILRGKKITIWMYEEAFFKWKGSEGWPLSFITSLGNRLRACLKTATRQCSSGFITALRNGEDNAKIWLFQLNVHETAKQILEITEHVSPAPLLQLCMHLISHYPFVPRRERLRS